VTAWTMPKHRPVESSRLLEIFMACINFEANAPAQILQRRQGDLSPLTAERGLRFEEGSRAAFHSHYARVIWGC